MKATIIIIIGLFIIAATLSFLKLRSKGRTANKTDFSSEEYERYYEAKEAALERILGPMHNMVGHAFISFHAGGHVDMYYFTNAIPGTACVTMELIEPDGSGPKPNRIGTYELIAFTKHKYSTEKHSPFNKTNGRLCGIFTTLGHYSYEAVLNPKETCEIPMSQNETVCLILDEYKKDGVDFEINGRRHCLLLCIEVFRSELEYAMKHGSAVVLNRLKEKGHYPYSDLDRKPVF